MIIHFKQTYYTAKQFDAAVDALDKHLPSLKDYETVAEMSKIVAIKANNIPLAISHGNLILDSFSFVKPVTYLALASMGSITKAFHWSFIVFLFIDKFCKTLGSICEV